ncbi:uncharacterized protein EI97DRAFT_456118 [Westerdykella ornata]|uniref:BTB domain-containing protein n=1 Tax=Westerdykella ornata TaxID=318751 RepID=A0A6A6JQ46_WESOR|nr:uncharacterized protein EI97DRAFT_456118 [Westerdykella ornata]KAF2278662.1 hypothetical protein EI97DRAFT_456118 [Westerdykella ornata]
MAVPLSRRRDATTLRQVPKTDLLFSILSGGIVQLSVGEDETPFDAHIELLCAHSPFFDNALKGRFQEAETKIIALPEDDPDSFSDLLSYVYTKRISVDEKATTWMDLCKLWVMADKYQIPALQNAVMAKMSKKWKEKV